MAVNALASTVNFTDAAQGLWDKGRVLLTLEVLIDARDLPEALNAILSL